MKNYFKELCEQIIYLKWKALEAVKLTSNFNFNCDLKAILNSTNLNTTISQ
jgi:hypothetical protein